MVKKKVGRPEKYSKKILDKAKDYLLNYDKLCHPFPSIIGLARVIDIGNTTIHNWSKDKNKKEFRDTLEKIKDEQHLQALHKGFNSESNTAITKLLLHNFGYSDKQEIEQSGSVVTVIELQTKFKKGECKS